MADIYGTYFTYGGRPSQQYGLVFANLDTSRFTKLSGDVNSVSIFNKADKSRYLVDDDYTDSPLSFEVEIMTYDGNVIPESERRQIEKWLFNRAKYYKLYFIDGEVCESGYIVTGDGLSNYDINTWVVNDTHTYNITDTLGNEHTLIPNVVDGTIVSVNYKDEVIPLTYDNNGNLIRVGDVDVNIVRDEDPPTPTDEKNLYLKCRFMNPEKIEYNGGIIGYKATLEADSNMFWEDETVQTFEIDNSNTEHTDITVTTDYDMNEYIYPRVTIITGRSGGDIIIYNHTDSNTRFTRFVSLPPNAQIVMDGDTKYINDEYYNVFKDQNFIRLLDGDNIFTISGDVAEVEFRFNNRRRF